MFSALSGFTTRSTRPLRPLRMARQYTTTAPPRKRITQSFDKSMFYPAFLLVLLGSQIINVMNAQRKVEDLERRYKLKMDKIDDLILKVKSGEPVNVERELELVNKLFMRQSGGSYSVMGRGPLASHIKKQEDLVLEEEDITEEKLAKMLGLDFGVAKKELGLEESQSKESVAISKDVIKVNREEIDQQMRREKELLSYKLEPEAHIIVETPGEYVDAAKDTKVKKFL